MNFASDNTGPAHPKVLQAILDADAGSAAPYGNDSVTEAARNAVRTLFEAPEAVIEFVVTGSVANALALACFARPWDGILCHRTAHVEEDECGAPEFYSDAKLILVDGDTGKMDPQALEAAILQMQDRGIHGAQPGPVTLTNITELGSAYTLDELRAVATVAKSYDLPVHLDGARFANACAALGCSPAEMTWKLGIDAVSFGGTKNGCLGVEAIVLFDPERRRELELRRKRGGHLLSKHRYLSAQMLAYASDGLWLDMAQAANARMAQLLSGLPTIEGARVCYPPAGNLAFLDLPKSAHRRAFDAGVIYTLYPGSAMDDGDKDGHARCRIVMDWSKSDEDVDRLLSLWRGAV